MPVFIVKQHTASPFEYFYQNELADEILLGLGQLATDHCTVAPSPGEHFAFARNESSKSKLKH